jgi:hypothetical protein
VTITPKGTITTKGKPGTGARVSYPKRWENMTPEKKLSILGTPEDIEDIDAVLAGWYDLSDEQRAEILEEDWEVLVATHERLVAVEEHRNKLQAARNKLCVKLMVEGVQQIRVADRLGLTSMAINFAVGGPVSRDK